MKRKNILSLLIENSPELRRALDQAISDALDMSINRLRSFELSWKRIMSKHDNRLAWKQNQKQKEHKERVPLRVAILPKVRVSWRGRERIFTGVRYPIGGDKK